MLTPQEISEKGFDKVMLNGYDTGEVDDFLDSVSNDYNALYKENAILKGKLKVLVEKVEEYRSTEDAMRMALLTAQRMGEEITNEAQRNKEEMLQQTDIEIKAKLSDTAKRISEEEARLSIATKETTKFIELSQAIMRKHSEFLNKLEVVRQANKSKQAAAGQTTPPAGKTKSVKPVTQPSQQPMQQPGQPMQQPGQQQMPLQQQQMPLQQQEYPNQAAQYQQMQQFGQAPLVSPEQQARQAASPYPDIDDIASQIGSVVEQLSDDETAAPPVNNSAYSADPHPSLFEDDDSSVKLYSPDNEEPEVDISPRPKFDFDDLKFGANFETDD